MHRAITWRVMERRGFGAMTEGKQWWAVPTLPEAGVRVARLRQETQWDQRRWSWIWPGTFSVS